jgi:tricorn protease
MRKRTAISWTVLGFLFLLGVGSVQAATKLLRFPDIQGDKVAFCYGGDLWTAPAAGGNATRLTAHPGYELFPRFSPDGQWIAFTGQYDGDEQVYVIPSSGGIPRQLTFYPARGPLPPRWGYDNQVYDWTADGKSILFRSMRYGASLTDTRLFLVSLDGGLPTPLPLPQSGGGDLSPDGTKVAYSPLVRDFRTWKRYEGGWAQELYVFDLGTYELTRVTDHPRADRDPMWIGNTIYFSSDRDGTLNLYAFDLDNSETTQLTRSETWDVRWPSDDGTGRIVYELNGELQVFDIAAGREQPISIAVPDDGLSMRPARISAAGNIEGFELSPKGERALFVARGDIFTAPIEKGPTRNLTRSSGAHDKWARWSPDGRKIAYVSDSDGEEEIYLVDQDGTGEPEQITRGGQAMRYAPEWSPDGGRLAFSDKSGRLYVMDLEGRTPELIADEERGQLRDYVWSPHGGYLAFSMSDPSGFQSIYIWSAAGGELHRVTGPEFNEFGPAWDPEGNYLYYLGDREFAPQIAAFEWNYAADRETYIFAVALRADVPHPFPPESDEVTLDDGDDADGESTEDEDGDADGDDDGENGDDEENETPIVIEFDGLAGRVARVPVDADNYGGLSASEGHLLYVRGTPFYYGRQADTQPALQIFSFEKREAKTLAEEAQGYALAADGLQGPGPPCIGLQGLRRFLRGGGRGQGCLHRRAGGGPGSGGGVGPDLRRGLAALPGFLLRGEHARL